jgi:hypothetical protein
MSHSRASQRMRQGATDITANMKGGKMRANKRFNLLLGLVLVSGMSLGLSGSWAGDRDDDGPSTHVGRAECRRGDNPETGLQGQIPMPDRLSGFKGFNCNLKKTASTSASRGDGLWQQFAYARDRAGHLCGYAGGTYFSGNPGTVVVDLTDPHHSVQTAILTTPGMITPGEGLRAHEGRGLLVSGNYQNGVPPIPNSSVADGFDVYDIGTDCRHPLLLVSNTMIEFDTTGLVPFPGSGPWPNPDRIYGHEGAFAPDGMTYYLSDVPHDVYHAIDLSDPTKPKMLASFVNPFLSRPNSPTSNGGTHGLSISSDGRRAYVSSLQYDFASPTGATPATGPWHDGFVIFDTSEIQARRPNPKVPVISESYWNDASINQMTIPAKIRGRHYLITTEEGGSGQFNARGDRSACAAGRTPFGMARIHDIENERAPRLVAKIVLEANDPANCAVVDPEIGGVSGFVYDVHMCSVDNRDDATTLACGYFQSGIRVYDIRDPDNVKEIAYFTPAAKTAGVGAAFTGLGPGWCAAIPFLDASSGMLYSSCADTGIVSLKFNDDVWPFHNSKTPRDKQL